MSRFWESKNRMVRGFALPTVLITSVTMMIVLLVSLQSVSSISVSLKNQYDQKMLDEALESGIAYASYCLGAKQTPTWTQLRNDTDCDGNTFQVSGTDLNCTTSNDARCGVVNNAQYRSYFEVSGVDNPSGTTKQVTVTGHLALKRTSSGAVYKTVDDTRRLAISQLRKAENDRAVQRYWQVGATAYGTTTYTGVSRIDFGAAGTNNPTATANQTASGNPGANYIEGITVVTDKDGNYQFSSDGINAWDKNDTLMPGASSLGSSNSTSQGVIAFPIGKANKYVIIGNSAGDDSPDGTNPGAYGKLTRAVVDMSLRGGLGDIVSGSKTTLERTDLNALDADTSNDILTEPNGTNYYTGQFMSAAPESSGKGYWVVFGTPGRAYFYAILFDNNGNPVKIQRSDAPGGEILACQAKYSSGSAYYWRAGFGTLHFNNSYTKFIAKSGGYTGYGTASDCRSNGVLPSGYNRNTYNQGRDYLMSFNAATGAMTSGMYWEGTASSSCIDTRYANAGYSIDFSPGENYVYETNIYPGRIYRYKIKDDSGNDITNSSTIASSIRMVATSDTYSELNANNPLSSGQIRRAPDGRMYVALQYSNSISYIVNPDAADDVSGGTSLAKACTNTVGSTNNASNFKYRAFPLGGSVNGGVKSSLGLPDYVTRYVPRKIQY